MAKSSDELTSFLLDSIEAAIGPVRTRKMFGGLGIWAAGTFLGMIWGDGLSIRLDEADEAQYLAQGLVPNDPASAGQGRKRYYELPADIIEHREILEPWLRKAIRAAQTAEA